VIALLVLVGVRAIPLARRGAGSTRTEDRAAQLLSVAVSGLPEERLAWGQAMSAELAELRRARDRRRFSAGCVRAIALLRARDALRSGDRGGAAQRGAIIAMAALALVLGACAFVRYPALRRDDGAWAAGAVLLVILLGYALGALALCRGTTPQAARVRRHGLVGGLAVGAAWLIVLAPPEAAKALVAVPLAFALLVPASVALLAGRATRDARAATGAALWSGLVGALLIFIVWAVTTYAQNGGPYDAQLLRDFHASGSHDLAAYAVGDNLGAALGLLVIVPTVALALGSLGARIAASASSGDQLAGRG
jgi:hypothetical protein